MNWTYLRIPDNPDLRGGRKTPFSDEAVSMDTPPPDKRTSTSLLDNPVAVEVLGKSS